MAREPQEQRFMLSPDGETGDWFHPLEIERRCPGWTDCTDMSDDLFQRLVTERMDAHRFAA